MAEPKEKFSGQITAVEADKVSNTGWKKYKVTFAGESTARKMDVPPDANYEPKVGDTVTVWSGKFNSWTLDKSSIPSAPAAGAPASGGGNASTGNGHSDNKFRDPKTIELQDYVRIFSDVYCACIPGLDEDNTPKTVDEIDGLIDQIVAKAKAVQAGE